MAVSNSGVRYYVAINGQMQVVSALNSMEVAAVRTDKAMVNLASTLQQIGGGLGLGLGMHSLVEFGKEAVQGAADFEVSMKRIMFASASAAEGIKNQQFILAEAAKYKIPFEEATAAYGKFLAMLAGSKMASNDIRELHDQILMIGKIKGISDGQLDAAVMNLGKMLESGGLDARHFRPLEMQLSGIGQYVANELGISIHQLAVLRNQGKMSTIDPQVLLTAIRKQAEDLKGFLPESLTTIQSGINEIHNAWLNFKNDLVFDNRSELNSLFATLKDGIGWLSEHKESLIAIGKWALFAGKTYVEWRVAMMALNGVQSLFTMGLTNGATAIGKETAATAGLNAELSLLNTNMEMFIALQNTANLQAMTFAEKRGLVAAMNQIPLPPNVVPASGNLIRSGLAGIGAAISSAAMPVIITYFAGEALNQMVGTIGAKGAMPYQFNIWDIMNNLSGADNIFMKIMLAQNAEKESARIQQEKNIALTKDLMYMRQFDKYDPYTFAYTRGTGNEAYTTPAARNGKGGSTGERIAPPQDKITGQRIITINNNFKEINGVKEMNVQNGGKVDKDMIGNQVRDILMEVANEIQTREGE